MFGDGSGRQMHGEKHQGTKTQFSQGAKAREINTRNQPQEFDSKAERQLESNAQVDGRGSVHHAFKHSLSAFMEDLSEIHFFFPSNEEQEKSMLGYSQ